MRRIPNLQNYCKYDEKSGRLVVDPYAFTPRKSDTDGMSLYREDFTTSEEVALYKPPKAEARVARISVQQLAEAGITEIIPDPQDGPAGHVYIPALKYVDTSTFTKEQKTKQKRATDKTSLALSQHATKNGVWARSGLPAPGKP